MGIFDGVTDGTSVGNTDGILDGTSDGAILDDLVSLVFPVEFCDGNEVRDAFGTTDNVGRWEDKAVGRQKKLLSGLNSELQTG